MEAMFNLGISEIDWIDCNFYYDYSEYYNVDDFESSISNSLHNNFNNEEMLIITDYRRFLTHNMNYSYGDNDNPNNDSYKNFIINYRFFLNKTIDYYDNNDTIIKYKQFLISYLDHDSYFKEMLDLLINVEKQKYTFCSLGLNKPGTLVMLNNGCVYLLGSFDKYSPELMNTKIIKYCYFLNLKEMI